MPYINEYVDPERFFVRDGNEFYHTYEHDEIEQGKNRYTFFHGAVDQFDPDEVVDVQRLPVPPAGPNLNQHPPFVDAAEGRRRGFNDYDKWQKSDEYKALKEEWAEWHDYKERDAIQNTLIWALANGLIRNKETTDDPNTEINFVKDEIQEIADKIANADKYVPKFEAVEGQSFKDHEDWVNNATARLTDHEQYRDTEQATGKGWQGQHFTALCFDQKGRRIRNGGDFKLAEEEGTFPVWWIWPDQICDLIMPKNEWVSELLHKAGPAFDPELADLTEEERAPFNSLP